ncbi:hypothetical protein NJ7G_0703 [Natrinema sp. J7-2]|nr:hypothetical protein NJ7G_0703 [Natrinema sp. J7-2]
MLVHGQPAHKRYPFGVSAPGRDRPTGAAYVPCWLGPALRKRVVSAALRRGASGKSYVTLAAPWYVNGRAESRGPVAFRSRSSRCRFSSPRRTRRSGAAPVESVPCTRTASHGARDSARHSSRGICRTVAPNPRAGGRLSKGL